MFERLTDRARRAVVVAQESARNYGHSCVGTEHLLYGLHAEGEGVAYQALVALDIPQLDTLGTYLSKLRLMSQPSGPAPFSIHLKRVFELSLREALQLGHNYIGTEHLLLGIARDGEGRAIEYLASHNINPTDIRQKVISTLAGYIKEARPQYRRVTSELRECGVSALSCPSR